MARNTSYFHHHQNLTHHPVTAHLRQVIQNQMMKIVQDKINKTKYKPIQIKSKKSKLHKSLKNKISIMNQQKRSN
jgi:hypothetical protein